jgi:ABC-2 type transport system permease protein
VSPRPGSATARPTLTSPLGLALRLQPGALLGWSAGLFVSGLSIGLTGRDAESLVGDSDQIDKISAPRAATSSTSTSPCRC